MKRQKTLLTIIRRTALASILFTLMFCHPVLAVSESEVQARVADVGKETVAGNVLIWFLCAIAFLKVSQKIDSFMSSLGVNVGHTGGSMMAEAVIAARGITEVKNFSSRGFRGGHGGKANSSNGPGGSGGFLSGGLSGIVSRNVAENARKSVTAPAFKTSRNSYGTGGNGQGADLSRSSSGSARNGTALHGLGIGGRMYASSVSKGGDFANNVIGTVAAGSRGTAGSITGERAVEALHSYLGNTALGPGAANIPQFSNVEIGGGRITGTEISEEHPGGIDFGMYHSAQYARPDGEYSTVQTKDGESWYKQYATDKVDKSPYMAPDGSIAYKESIIKRLPPPPVRKDKQ